MFDLAALVRLLLEQGHQCTVGSIADIRVDRQAHFERWLKNRDGFIAIQDGNIDYVGIEDVVRMGPFFDVHCLIANDFIADSDDNAHNLLDTAPYYQLKNGNVTSFGWSGGVLSSYLAKDVKLTQALSSIITSEEVRHLRVKAQDYCCVIDTCVWDPAGLASVFWIMDRMAIHIRKLVGQVHFGEDVDR